MWLPFKDVAALLAPGRFQMKPLEQHLRSLREHREVCEEKSKRLTIDIFFAQTDGNPLRHQRLFNLHFSRWEFRRQANVCRDAISPISWIPKEILGLIFTRCLPLDHRFSRTVAPLLFLQVSRLWRGIAISTRSFWSQLAFWTPFSNIDRTCYPLRLIGPWVARSRGAPLDIFLLQGLVYYHMKFVVEVVLLEHYPQCRHLDIHVTSESAPALINFVGLPEGSLTSLESLVLEGLDESYFAGENAEPTITVFRNSPRLRKLTTNALDFAFRIEPSTSYAIFDYLFISWKQLTHLMITDFITVDVFVVAISECTGLEFLRVSIDLGDDEEFLDMDEWLPDEPLGAFRLPKLSELHISITDGICIPSTMNALAFPALRRLHFRRSESDEFEGSFSWENSPHFLRQLHNLQYLALVGCVGTAEEVVVLLQHTPQVTHLKLDIPTNYQFLVPTLFPPLDPDTSSVFLAGPLHKLANLAFRLTKPDFPFPSLYIRNTVDLLWPNCPLVDLTIVAHRGSHRHLREICAQFSFTPLQTVVGTPGGRIGRSTRYHNDGRLIDCEDTSRRYTIIDPSTTLVDEVTV